MKVYFHAFLISVLGGGGGGESLDLSTSRFSL